MGKAGRREMVRDWKEKTGDRRTSVLMKNKEIYM